MIQYFKELKEKKPANSKLIISENILSSDCSTVKNESEVTFLKVEKLKECILSRSALNEMLKEITQWKGNDTRDLGYRERLAKWEYENKCIANMKTFLRSMWYGLHNKVLTDTELYA